MITIGDVKAAANPLCPGLSCRVFACRATCPCSDVSHWSTLICVGSWNSGLRSASGSSIDGNVLKNSTPATKSFIDSPVIGSSRSPPGISTLISTCSGPSSLKPSRMVKPAMPAIEKPPSSPR